LDRVKSKNDDQVRNATDRCYDGRLNDAVIEM
jgi:hypothetical protein